MSASDAPRPSASAKGFGTRLSPTHDRATPLPPRAGSPLHEVASLMFARYRAVSGGVPAAPAFRTIVVVGAGASNAACNLPLGKSLANSVMEAVLARGIPKWLIEAELDRLEHANGLQRNEFETLLLAAGRFAPAAVLAELCDKCDFEHYPSLTYEILAHFMKHGLLDAIVNFNFDELLDHAIDEELGSEQYTRIVRDGDWARKLRVHEGNDPWRFDLPLYIKPHGTVSDPAS